jgi:mannitol-specific phosphotransferase system IIBC component
MQPHHDHTTSAGTITGTLFTVCATIDIHDYLKTIVLALVGAIVSFVVTLVLKRVMKRFEK